jgi:hypothetical protein
MECRGDRTQGPGRPVAAPGGWSAWFAVLAAVSVCALAVAFVRLYRDARTGEIGVAVVARAAVAWTVPILPAPPLMSLDAYSYAAQGWLLLSKLDAYSVGPERLGAGPILDAVSPVWRATPAPYGPLALAVFRVVAEVGQGNLAATVYVLRLLAVIAVAATAMVTLRLTAPSRRAAALALVTANPLVLLHLVGGVHLDALLGGLAVLTVIAVRRRWWAWAALAAATAFAVKLPGLVLVGYVLLSRLRSDGWTRQHATIVLGAIAGAASLGYAALVPNGWGWIGALDVPGLIRHPYDPATVLGWALHLLTPLDLPAAMSAARMTALAAGSLAVLGLIWHAAGSASARRSAGLVGAALLAVALAAPTVHSWYIAWGLALVAAGAAGHWATAMAGVSVALCFTSLPPPLQHHPLGITLTLVLLGMVAASAAPMSTVVTRWRAKEAVA